MHSTSLHEAWRRVERVQTVERVERVERVEIVERVETSVDTCLKRRMTSQDALGESV